ncbi:uncharacterized protein I303_105152 [Kwoniella dejecticola CBS 10117]|uniref:Carbohydrate kinase PfkB domain-containing protein n=1 Tax=Kwoniella dejecticola CBS 10117 TaxID=1296121 RepID=A0A1A6A3A4_9TREE|nr:uncharacterized protein I303_05402 [Kwoniella dejecticola CBS 10117]OBR84543.1 hypothetical protein I303_05402 [Kwoniella dejecticola CBS 10117]
MNNPSGDVASTSRRIVTLEQFIVDTFTLIGEDGVERPVEQPDQIGGGGTYAIIGARIFTPPSELGMIIDYTPATLTKAIRDDLKYYGSDMWAFRERTDGHPTARAVNRYQGQSRGFEYLTKPLLLTPHSLSATPFADPLPSTIHFISYPAPRAEIILSEVKELRDQKERNPIIVWEPEDESLEVMQKIAKDIDVIGPNHNEVIRLFQPHIPPEVTPKELQTIYAELCLRIAQFRPKIGVVIRCGCLGCCYAATPTTPHNQDRRPDVKWVPAYWNPQREGWSEGKVVDPTGAGNAFMGGLAAAVDRGYLLDEAVIWGSVAASFTIEQNGLPVLTTKEGKELWNDEDPSDRVQIMKRDLGWNES